MKFVSEIVLVEISKLYQLLWTDKLNGYYLLCLNIEKFQGDWDLKSEYLTAWAFLGYWEAFNHYSVANFSMDWWIYIGLKRD